MRISGYIFLVLVSMACSVPDQDTREVPRFLPSDQPPVKPNEATPYTFGYLEVPENWDRGDGKTIKLPVYIFRSRSENPSPDPVLLTFGGPGSSSLSAAPYMKYYQYLEDRDLILFEQRGTRYALPHLSCPEWGSVAAKLSGTASPAATWDTAYVRAAKACRERMEKASINLNAYRTLASARDIEALRRVLQLKKINLLTTSYSTKIAQVMMREFPEGIRSVVMDSALPLNASWDTSSSTNLMEVLERILQDCAKNPDCDRKYPDLKEGFIQYLNNLNEQPQQITVSGRKVEKRYTFSAPEVIELIAQVSSSEVAGIPRQISTLINGNISSLKAYANQLASGVATGEGMGMRLSVWCAEETAFTTPEAVERERSRNPLLSGRSPMVFSYEVCGAWGVEAAAEREKLPVRSDLPVLLISGTYDAVTPTKWARQLQSSLPNSYLLTFPGWTHGPITNWSNPCAMEAARAFFNAPNGRPSLPCYQGMGEAPSFE
jgi:pimeloyl-ACP methyl ester carboxylesterase